jgi:alpha-L-rhamnosidase
VYELYLNGEKQGDECLLPGIHAYEKWLQYQTFALDLKPGDNAVEIRLGNGWYKGRYSIARQKANPDAAFSCIAEIRIQYEDGGEDVIGTDGSWRAARGQVTMDSIYDGEVYDATADAGEETPAVPLYSVFPACAKRERGHALPAPEPADQNPRAAQAGCDRHAQGRDRA